MTLNERLRQLVLTAQQHPRNSLERQMALRQLALTAQQYPQNSPERQMALDQLCRAILTINELYRGRVGSRYQEIRKEATQNLFEYICQNINEYKPKHEVMAWCNFLLRQRFFPEASSKVLGEQGIQIMSLDDLNNQLASPEPSPNLVEHIKSYVQLEPEFRETHIQNHPEANFTVLVTLRLEGKPWKEISEIFGIPIATLSSFYQRCVNRFSSRIREYLENI